MKFLDWLKTIDKEIEFYFVFVVASGIASDYKKQTLQIMKNTIHLNPKSEVKTMKQYIFGLIKFLDWLKTIDIPMEFYSVFVVASVIASDY